MKKIISLFVCVILSLGVLTSCSGETTATSSADDTASTEITSSVEATSEETSSLEQTSSEEEPQLPLIETEVPVLSRDLSKEKRVRILPFGDSFTAIKPAAYRYYLYEMLYKNGGYFQYVGSLTCDDDRLGSFYRRFQGTGGHTVLNAIDVYKTKIREIVDYDVMVLFFGINGYNPSTFESEYETLLNLIFEDNPTAYVYAVGAINPETAQKTETVVKSFSKKGFNVTYVNMFQRDDITFDSQEDYITQTVERGHLNNSGNKKFASVIYDYIKDTVSELNKLPPNNKRLPTAVSGVSLNYKQVTLKIGEEKSVTYQITPDNADTKSVVWHTSNPEIATVNEHGLITATGEGEAVVTAVSLDGLAQRSLTVTVLDEQFNIHRIGEKVFGDEFKDSSNWEENAKLYVETPNTSNISFKWGDANVTLNTKETVNVSKNFTFELSYCMSTNHDEDYVAFKVGEYEIRIYNTGKKVTLNFKGAEVGTYQGRKYPFEGKELTFVVKDNTANLFIGNEQVITAQTQNTPTTSKITLDYQCDGGVAVFDNITLSCE